MNDQGLTRPLCALKRVKKAQGFSSIILVGFAKVPKSQRNSPMINKSSNVSIFGCINYKRL